MIRLARGRKKVLDGFHAMFVAHARVGDGHARFPAPASATLCCVFQQNTESRDVPPYHAKLVDMFSLWREGATRQRRSRRHVERRARRDSNSIVEQVRLKSRRGILCSSECAVPEEGLLQGLRRCRQQKDNTPLLFTWVNCKEREGPRARVALCLAALCACNAWLWIFGAAHCVNAP